MVTYDKKNVNKHFGLNDEVRAVFGISFRCNLQYTRRNNTLKILFFNAII